MGLGLAGLGLAGAETALPAVLGRAVDAVVGRAPGSWLAWVVLLVALLAACDVLDDLAEGGATASSTAWLRRSVLHHLLRLDTPTAGRFTPGDLASRLVGNAADAGRVTPFMVQAGTNLARKGTPTGWNCTLTSTGTSSSASMTTWQPRAMRRLARMPSAAGTLWSRVCRSKSTSWQA